MKTALVCGAGKSINIDEMQAGRELDALIAEKVMRFTQCTCNCALEPKMVAGFTACAVCGLDIPLAYSTDIAAAWQVVEKLNLFRYMVLNKNADEKYIIRRYSEWLFPDGFTAASTAQLAICRAALKTIEEQVNAE